MARTHPQSGDVLVSQRTATVEHDVGVLPFGSHQTFPHYEQALATATDLAQRLQVDAWFTADHTHFLEIAAFRSGNAVRATPGDVPRRHHRTPP